MVSLVDRRSQGVAFELADTVGLRKELARELGNLFGPCRSRCGADQQYQQYQQNDTGKEMPVCPPQCVLLPGIGIFSCTAIDVMSKRSVVAGNSRWMRSITIA